MEETDPADNKEVYSIGISEDGTGGGRLIFACKKDQGRFLLAGTTGDFPPRDFVARFHHMNLNPSPHAHWYDTSILINIPDGAEDGGLAGFGVQIRRGSVNAVGGPSKVKSHTLLPITSNEWDWMLDTLADFARGSTITMQASAYLTDRSSGSRQIWISRGRTPTFTTKGFREAYNWLRKGCTGLPELSAPTP